MIPFDNEEEEVDIDEDPQILYPEGNNVLITCFIENSKSVEWYACIVFWLTRAYHSTGF